MSGEDRHRKKERIYSELIRIKNCYQMNFFFKPETQINLMYPFKNTGN